MVFYRIDDPRTETNFRLYEIEYLIAQKLNGARSLDEVIDVVKAEHNFDISASDLQRFVSQLESMGFLESGDGGTLPEAETQEFETSSAMPTDDLLPEIGMDEAVEVDRAELDRLMRSALLHVKQGYLLHARDYFLAARELDPHNEKLATVISHLEIVGETPAAAEMEYIWEQAASLAPEIADQLGELMSEPGMAPSPETLRVDTEEDIRSRVLWTFALLVVLGLGAAAIYWATQELDIFAAPEPVRVTELESTRIPVFFAEPAASVVPAQEEKLGFAESGKVASVEVAVGDTVQQGDLVATLEINGRNKKKLKQAQAVVDKARVAYDKAAKKLGALEAEAQQIQLQRDQADERLRELQPKQLLGQGGVSKRDIEKWKRAKVQANKKLTKLAKKRRKPEAAERKAKQKLDAAQRKLAETERRVGGRILRAPITGRVIALELAPGAAVKAKVPVVTIRDERSVVLAFELSEAPTFQAGGQAFISVKKEKPTNAKVRAREDQGDGATIEIELSDPTGAYIATEPEEFRLVRDYVEPAFDVPSSALSEVEGKPHVFVVRQNRAQATPVSILERDAAQAVVVNEAGALRDGDRVVTADIETGSVASLKDGSLLDVQIDDE